MKLPLLLPILFALTACAGMDDEEDIPLSEVPAAALEAARAAVPGIELEEAEIEQEDGQKVYELSGTLGDREFEIEVSGTGEIIEVEEED